MASPGLATTSRFLTPFGITSPCEPCHSEPAGEESAFASLYIQHRREIHQTIYKMVHCHTLAEDLTQETFLNAWRAYGAQVENPRAWLYKIARNRTLDHLQGLKPEVSLDSMLEETAEGSYAPEFCFRDWNLELTVLRVSASKIIGGMPPRQRTAIEATLAGMSCAEVGELIGGFVWRQIHAGQMALREALA